MNKKEKILWVAKRLPIVLVIILAVILIWNYEPEEENIELTSDVIEQIIKDVYTPDSLEEFLKSKDKYTYQVMTQNVADDFYWYDGNELSDDALKRKVTVDVIHCSAENNSSNEEFYKANVRLSYADNSVDNFTITFYVDDCGWIYSYEITPTT